MNLRKLKLTLKLNFANQFKDKGSHLSNHLKSLRYLNNYYRYSGKQTLWSIDKLQVQSRSTKKNLKFLFLKLKIKALIKFKTKSSQSFKMP